MGDQQLACLLLRCVLCQAGCSLPQSARAGFLLFSSWLDSCSHTMPFTSHRQAGVSGWSARRDISCQVTEWAVHGQNGLSNCWLQPSSADAQESCATQS